MHTIFERFTNRHLIQLIIAYVAIIIVYVLVPENVDMVRHYLSRVAIALLAVIAVLVFDRMARA